MHPETSAAGQDPIAVGDSVDTLEAKLGRVKGRMKTGEDLVLLFRSGTVTIRDGKVKSFKLDSRAQLAEREQARRAREAAREQADRAAVARKQANKAALAKALRDPELAAKPPFKQLEFWKAFQAAHPGVSVADKIAGLEAQIEARKKPSEREKLEKQIALVDAEYTTWKNKTGLSRRGLRIRSAKLAELERKLAELNAKIQALPKETPTKAPQ
jgi:hypothetical protein